MVISPIVINPLNLIEHPQTNDLYSLVNILIYLILSPFVILFFSISLWILTCEIHSFVDLAGRDTRIYTLNYLLVLLVIVLATSAGEVFGVFDAIRQYGFTFFATGLIMVCCINTNYFINSVVCGIFVLKGYHFKNKFICPFTKQG